MKTPKPCPFCFSALYFYKTRNGLLRHVMNSHMHDARKQAVYVPVGNAPRFLRIDIDSGAKYEPISGWNEVEDFLIEYITGFKNPSKRSSRFWKYVNGQ